LKNTYILLKEKASKMTLEDEFGSLSDLQKEYDALCEQEVN
jgi:hypothetical protein